MYSFYNHNLLQHNEILLTFPTLQDIATIHHKSNRYMQSLDARELLRLIHHDVPQPFYAFYLFIGRKMVDLQISLTGGRRICVYHCFKYNNKLIIQKGWIKLMHLSKVDIIAIAQHHMCDLWQSSKFIVSVGGELYPYRRLELMKEYKNKCINITNK